MIDKLEVKSLAVACWSLIAAMQHYFRFSDTYTGSDDAERERVNAHIKGSRLDGYANLLRFARINAEKHCSSKVLTAQLHTLVCSIFDQETAQGMTSALGELFMERAVSSHQTLPP